MNYIPKKRKKLRHYEYYNIQGLLDALYNRSQKGSNFKNLYELIISRENILVAYRNIKRNKGSKTYGVIKENIDDLSKLSDEEIIEIVRSNLAEYKPQPVRRKEIQKENGKMRPLGIPTIRDRLIQQCILQILEPICEAKFHKHSYGFRPNRNTSHAIARANFLINCNQMYYCVDIDIKGFFDNVNHGKLLKQMWTLGIRDKKVISIISKILKSEIKGEGIPTKGTPQGGIISPLLSNIVLNELDWWLSDQWLTFETEKEYSYDRNKSRSLRKTKLKEIYHVRYADDFKIFCKDFKTAQRIYIATVNWLRERLGLEISESKSKIVNLRNNNSEFLGFKFKAVDRGDKYICISHVSDKSKKKIERRLREQFKRVNKYRNSNEVKKLNAMILGMHNYYKMATRVSDDFNGIYHNMYRFIMNITENLRCKSGFKSKAYMKIYGKYNYKEINLLGYTLYPIPGVKMFTPICLNQNINSYTEKGRKLIHDKLKGIDHTLLVYLMENPVKNRSVEYNDNRVSLYVGQNGKCAISGVQLQVGNMEVHHKKPISEGGTDIYKNLIFLTSDIHKLVHMTDESKINVYIDKLKLKKEQIEKLNKLRCIIGKTNL